MHSDEKIKDRIRKLLNVARNDAATEGEIENALRFAQALLDKHHLREEDLAREPRDQYAEIERASRDRAYASILSKAYSWECLLATVCCELVGGVEWYIDGTVTLARDPRGLAIYDERGHATRGKRICFYGIAEDAAMAAEIFHELRLTILGMARLKFGGCYRGDGGAYSAGFVAGIRAQMDQRRRRQRITAESDCRAVVLLDRRQDLIARKRKAAVAWLSQQGVRLRSGTTRGSSGSQEAWSEGREDGLNSEVQTTRRGKLCGS